MVARHLRCLESVGVEHGEKIIGFCLTRFKPDEATMWTSRYRSGVVEIEARFLDSSDGYSESASHGY